MPLESIIKHNKLWSKRKEKQIRLEKLPNTVSIHGANDELIEVCKYKINTTIHLESDEGQSVLNNLDFIVSSEIREILIGDETLEQMNLSPEQVLRDRMKQEQKDVRVYEFENIEELKSVLLRYIRTNRAKIHDKDEDSMEMEEPDIAPELGEVDYGEVQYYIEESIKKSSQERFKLQNWQKAESFTFN